MKKYLVFQPHYKKESIHHVRWAKTDSCFAYFSKWAVSQVWYLCGSPQGHFQDMKLK
ncbi:hypothetical protein [Virgibacillus pantothenticus]|uniref:hypothetical protein n=1 Tax=Virgibacillus pantothenticus TaxID=1473 RepID=UPI001BAF497C|nr:hypothetical protein [Virgibacillus pantothenticus]